MWIVQKNNMSTTKLHRQELLNALIRNLLSQKIINLITPIMPQSSEPSTASTAPVTYATTYNSKSSEKKLDYVFFLLLALWAMPTILLAVHILTAKPTQEPLVTVALTASSTTQVPLGQALQLVDSSSASRDIAIMQGLQVIHDKCAQQTAPVTVVP